MERRQYLTALAGVAAGTAGAAGVFRYVTRDGGESPPAGNADAGADTNTDDTGSEGQLSVADEELRRAAPTDAIPAIVDPVFAPSWDESVAGEAVSEFELRPDDEIIGIERDGIARAYPLKVLSRHEVVNDDIDGPELVTYCPVCDSGVVVDRTVAGRTRTFGVSGYLYRSNLVLYDEESESLWSQLGGEAIRGPLEGTPLHRTGSAVTTWGEWTDRVPDTEVLVPPPASNTVVGPVSFRYNLDIYERREQVAERYPEYGPLGDIEWSDTRLRRRATVVGVATDGESRAYPQREARVEDPINDVIGSLPVLVTATHDAPVRAYERRLGGETLRFETDADGELVAGGSRWSRLTGQALDGPHEGAQLRLAPGEGPLYWAAWLQFNPDTTVYGIDADTDA